MPRAGWPYTSKPGRGATLDPTAPLARGLRGFYALNEAGGGKAWDATGQLPLALASYGSTTAWVSGGSGLALNCNGTSLGASAAPPAASYLGWPISWSVGFYQAGSSGGSDTALFGMGAGGAPFFNGFIGINNGGNYFIAVNNGASLQSLSSTTGAASRIGTDNVLSGTVTPSGYDLYLNGKSILSASTAMAAQTYANSPTIQLGSYVGRNSGAWIYWAAWANRAWTPQEHAAIGSDPRAIWRLLYAPHPVHSWASLGASGGGGTTFSPAAAGGAVVGGVWSPAVSWSPVGLGGATGGGSASPSASWTTPAAGGAVEGGSAPPSVAWAPAAAGGPVAGGPSPPSATWTTTAAGGVVEGGIASPAGVLTATASGGAVTSGLATGSSSSATSVVWWRRPVGKPGRGAILDVAAPLARGLVSLWVLNEGSGLPVDVVSAARATTLTGSWAGSPYGLALSFDGASTYCALGTDPAMNIFGGPLTVAVLANITPPATGVTTAILDTRPDATSAGYVLQANSLSAGGTYRYTTCDGSNHIAISANGAIDGSWHLFAVSHSSAGANGVQFYRDGAAWGTFSSIPFALSAPTAIRYLATRFDHSAAYAAASFALVAAWNRALSADEHAEFARNPWQVFRVLRVLGSSPTVSTPAAVGGMELGGARSPAVSWSPVGLGGAVLSGLAPPSASWTTTAAGGVLAGGAAAPTGSSIFAATAGGGAVSSGATTPLPAWTPPAAGGVRASGAPSPSAAWTPSATGGAVVGGVAVVGPSAFAATASGGAVLGGRADGSILATATFTATAGGGAVLGGSWPAAASASFTSYVDPRAGTVLTARGATALNRVDPRAGTLILPRAASSSFGPTPTPTPTTSPIPFFVMGADGVTPYAGAVTVQVRTPASDWSAPAGAIVSDGSGLYTFAATSDDIAGARPLLLYATATGAGPGLAMWWDVANPYRVGQLGVPIPFWLGTAASSGNLPAVGAAAQLVLSTPGGAAAAGLGSVIEAGNGFFLYYPTPADMAIPTVLYAVGRASGAIGWAETYTIGA